jgi:hypothetical protein
VKAGKGNCAITDEGRGERGQSAGPHPTSTSWARETVVSFGSSPSTREGSSSTGEDAREREEALGYRRRRSEVNDRHERAPIWSWLSHAMMPSESPRYTVL